jgi:putative transcriptional regulator
MDIEKIARVIESDADDLMAELRESLAEMNEDKQDISYAPAQLLVKSARQKTNLSQQAFANLIKTPVATLRDWEQGRYTPPGAVICLFQMLKDHPEMVDELAV